MGFPLSGHLMFADIGGHCGFLHLNGHHTYLCAILFLFINLSNLLLSCSTTLWYLPSLDLSVNSLHFLWTWLLIPKLEVRQALHLFLSIACGSVVLLIFLRHSFSNFLSTLWIIAWALSVLIDVLSFKLTEILSFACKGESAMVLASADILLQVFPFPHLVQ